jgi:glycosyltransferase involved in cell wall biosynthesis
MARVLHLIDSLAPGGAERVAVQLVNELNLAGHTAWLCATRAEGLLKESLAYPAQYVFLKKRRTLDLRAFFQLVKLLRAQKIDILHAHSSSVYWAVPASRLAGCKLVWHDHYGDTELLDMRPLEPLKRFSRYIHRICSVNETLAAWARDHLRITPENVWQVNHYAVLKQRLERTAGDTVNILCLANFRMQKDHTNLFDALDYLAQSVGTKGWMVYLVGESKDPAYDDLLHTITGILKLTDNVRFVAAQADVTPWLFKCHIGVLSSRSEGLPVALLEYGLAGMAVVCTKVGACGEVLGGGKYGLLAPPGNSLAFGKALEKLYRDAALRQQLGAALSAHIQAQYSPEAAIRQLEQLYADVLTGT